MAGINCVPKWSLANKTQHKGKPDQRCKAVGLQSHRATDHDQETAQSAGIQNEKSHGTAEERIKISRTHKG